MKDALGREIPVGSEVLFLLQTGSQPSSKDLWPGKVARVAEGWVEIEYTTKGGLAGKAKRFSNLVLVTPEMRGARVSEAIAKLVEYIRLPEADDNAADWIRDAIYLLVPPHG